MKRISLVLFFSCWASAAFADKSPPPPPPPPEQQGGCSTSPAAPEPLALLAVLGLGVLISRRTARPRA